MALNSFNLSFGVCILTFFIYFTSCVVVLVPCPPLVFKVLYWNWSFCYKGLVFAVVSFAVALDQEQLKIVIMSICSKTMRVVPTWITNNRIIFIMLF